MIRSALLLMMVVSTAHASPQPERVTTISVEPIFLIAGIAELNVEVQPTAHLGLQAIAGYGGLIGGHISELGAEANVYIRREAAGPHFGVEVKYLWGSSSIPFVAQTMNADVTERELALYAGWKWIGWRNLTFVMQLGISKLDLWGGSPSDDLPRHQVVPAANLVVGYSF
ncbi:MAG: hypothetical protein ABI678_10615 [Kofleriaceae bacterium]